MLAGPSHDSLASPSLEWPGLCSPDPPTIVSMIPVFISAGVAQVNVLLQPGNMNGLSELAVVQQSAHRGQYVAHPPGWSMRVAQAALQPASTGMSMHRLLQACRPPSQAYKGVPASLCHVLHCAEDSQHAVLLPACSSGALHPAGRVRPHSARLLTCRAAQFRTRAGAAACPCISSAHCVRSLKCRREA